MNHIKRSDQDQSNLIDGTIIAFDPRSDGAYVTFAGRDGAAVIAAIDIEDLVRLGGTVLDAVENFDPEFSQEDQLRITPRGIEVLREMLASTDGSLS